MPLTTKERWTLCALVALNVLLKCSWLGVNELAHDEPFTVYWSQRPMAELWSLFATENNPPLYFLVIKAWSAFTPFEVAWLRVPSALCSALTVWPLFLLTRKLADTRAAVVACLLFSFSNYHFGFAHEVRAYALFALLSTACMTVLVSASDERNTAWLALLNVLLVYTHFFGWLLLGVQLLVVHLPEFRSHRRRYFTAVGAAAVAYVPYAFIFARRLGQSVTQGTWLSAPTPEELYNMVWRWSNAPVLAVVFLLVIVTASAKDRLRHVGLRIGLLWAFVPLLGMFLVSYSVPMFLDRYLVYAAPGFAVLVASAVSLLVPKGRATTAVMLTPALGMLLTFVPWKEGRYEPSRVVAQANTWCPNGCTHHVWPSWYQLTYRSALRLDELKEDQSPYLSYDMNRMAKLTHDTLRPTIVVDGSGFGKAAQQSWYGLLRRTYPNVDSVETDHKVWVYRFRK
ncbi:MAG: glycosyltransferase family 39 protein [Flavobacteriales bacterium]|nr:glycosyltransferase family 39 protein [Flavobacteriales bacterium]